VDLAPRIKNRIIHDNLIKYDETVIVGVSGGPDSICLLHILFQLNMNLRVVVVYVDHGLRPEETEYEKRLVAKQAYELGAIYETVTVNVHERKKKNKISMEEAARMVRYEALEEVRKRYKASSICVGHTADDQAEELLIRLIRGSGRTGLGGMKSRKGLIIRPLLAERKETLIDYLRKQNISYCQDSSNLDRSFLRNRIRLDLLPYLQENYNPSISETLIQTCKILQSEDHFLNRLTEESFKQIVHFDHGIKLGDTLPCPKTAHIQVKTFQQCDKAVGRRILEKLCWQMEARPSFRVIDQLLNLIHRGQNGSEVHLEKGLRAMKTGNTVTFSHPAGIKAYRGRGVRYPTVHKEIEKVGKYPFPALDRILSLTICSYTPELLQSSTLMVDAESITFPLLLRSYHAGEKFRPLGSPGRKKIGRFLSDQKIPKDKRPTYPVLLSGNRIIAVIGLQIDDDFRVSESTRNVLLIDWEE